MQELIGHRDVRVTIIYTHVLNIGLSECILSRGLALKKGFCADLSGMLEKETCFDLKHLAFILLQHQTGNLTLVIGTKKRKSAFQCGLKKIILDSLVRDA